MLYSYQLELLDEDSIQRLLNQDHCSSVCLYRNNYSNLSGLSQTSCCSRSETGWRLGVFNQETVTASELGELKWQWQLDCSSGQSPCSGLGLTQR